MPLDVYLKIPEDPNYDPTQIEIEDDLFNFVQYIEMILTTNRGEVFGAPELGANLEAYLWNPYVTSSTIKSEINRQIFQLCPNLSARIAFEVDVQFFKGDITDSILVDIIIEGEKVLGIVSTPSAN